jgi:predicted porin
LDRSRGQARLYVLSRPLTKKTNLMNPASPRAIPSSLGSRGSRWRVSLLLSAALAGLGVLTHAESARADLTIAKGDKWEVSTNGRVNAFLSYIKGDGFPAKNPGQTHNLAAGAGFESFQTDANNKIEAIRLRSGFLGNVLGFSAKMQLTDTTTVTSHIEIWSTIETLRVKATSNYPDVRQGYGKIEGPWGGLLVGRSLALFERGAISLDFNYQHGNGLGYPCNADAGGPTCGMVGYGVIFAGFNPQITYNTPKFQGFQVSAGLFDPVNAPGKYERTPLPRLEGEADYDAEFLVANVKSNVHAFVNGMWQKLSEQGNPDQVPRMPYEPRSVNPYGVNLGFWAEVFHVRAGFSMFQGKGLGMNNTLENTPIVFDSEGEARKFDGYYGVLGLNLDPLSLNVGYGITRVFATTETTCAHAPPCKSDFQLAMTNRFDPIKTQAAISAGINYAFGEHLVAALEYFRADHTWYFGDKQRLNFVNTGLTVLW